jgi:hypothetical protein
MMIEMRKGEKEIIHKLGNYYFYFLTELAKQQPKEEEVPQSDSSFQFDSGLPEFVLHEQNPHDEL